MIRRGDVVVEDGVVTAVEDGAEKGVRVTVEYDDLIRRAVAPAHKADRRRTETFYLTPEEWAAVLKNEAGGAVDGLLGRRVGTDIFPPGRV